MRYEAEEPVVETVTLYGMVGEIVIAGAGRLRRITYKNFYEGEMAYWSAQLEKKVERLRK